MKDIVKMSALLAQKGVKKVILRYSGRDGRGQVAEVNYLADESGFLGYDEISKLRISENDLCSLGEELLTHFKSDWADALGGRGELIWDPAKGIRIKHEERHEDRFELSRQVEQSEVLELVGQEGVPQAELDYAGEVLAQFESEDDTLLFFGFKALGEDGRLEMSKLFASAMKQVFSQAISKSFRDIEGEGGRVLEGSCAWTRPGEIRISATCGRFHYISSVQDLALSSFENGTEGVETDHGGGLI